MVLKRNDRWVRTVVAVLTLVGAIAAFALFGRPVAAGPNIWTPMGPQSFAGIATRDAAGNLYATSLYPAPRPDTSQPVSTVYRSSDGGQTWAAVGNYATAGAANYRSGVSMFSASANGSVLMVGVLTDIGMSLLKSRIAALPGGLQHPTCSSLTRMAIPK
jgi:hypothetical protein